MRLGRAFEVLLLLSAGAIAEGQTPSVTPLGPFAAAIDAEISSQETLFVDAAEAMPAEKFDFSPEALRVPGAALSGVRAFGMQVKHVAADNFAIWASVAGKPEPAGSNAPNGPPDMKSRAEILKFLKDSYAYSHGAVRSLTRENALGLVDFRGRRVTRISQVVLALTHVSDHYGQMVEYLRLAGVVPPASRPRSPVPAKASGG